MTCYVPIPYASKSHITHSGNLTPVTQKQVQHNQQQQMECLLEQQLQILKHQATSTGMNLE
jgi:hypothetical protein